MATPALRPVPAVRIATVADLPTRFGHFRIVGFRNDVDQREHVAVIRGGVAVPPTLAALARLAA